MAASRPRLLLRREGELELTGALTFATVTPFLEALEPFLSEGSLTVDLGGVEEIDSAGLALLVEWFKMARKRGVSLKYRHLPPTVWRLVALYDLETVLPLDRAEAEDRRRPPPER